MFDTGTQVSITNPTIKKIVGEIYVSQSDLRGKQAKVVQVKPTFEYQYLNDTGEPYVFVARASGGGLREIARPGYGGSHTVRFMEGVEIIITRRIGKNGAITIYVPAFSDPGTMDVARDMLLSDHPNKTDVMQMLLPALGNYASLAMAVLEAEVKALSAKPKKSTTSGKQLDREISAFLRRSGRS